MTTTQTPNLNHAAARLIEALDDTAAIAGLRDGLQRQITFYGTFMDPTNPAHAEARDLLAVWRALDDLAGAVQARKETCNG